MSQFTVKACGRAHAYCHICKPGVVQKLRVPKPAKVYERPCRNCGTCDACLGYTAPEGMKFCRKCGEAKPIEQFPVRRDTGGRRNQCYACRRKSDIEGYRCASCGRSSTRVVGASDVCSRCRPKQPNRVCATCGSAFATGMRNRDYCSKDCQINATRQSRIVLSRQRRVQILQAYGGAKPVCACCGEQGPKFLTIDHINGGGYQQMRSMGGGGYQAWLIRSNFPPGFQVLCYNCNMGRAINNGVCPHQE